MCDKTVLALLCCVLGSCLLIFRDESTFVCPEQVTPNLASLKQFPRTSSHRCTRRDVRLLLCYLLPKWPHADSYDCDAGRPSTFDKIICVDLFCALLHLLSLVLFSDGNSRVYPEQVESNPTYVAHQRRRLRTAARRPRTTRRRPLLLLRHSPARGRVHMLAM